MEAGVSVGPRAPRVRLVQTVTQRGRPDSWRQRPGPCCCTYAESRRRRRARRLRHPAGARGRLRARGSGRARGAGRFVAFVERVQGRHGAKVGLRIGVNTGEVVAGREAAARGELMVSGDAVNVAARLQQHAEPGEVLVGERTGPPRRARSSTAPTTTSRPRASGPRSPPGSPCARPPSRRRRLREASPG